MAKTIVYMFNSKGYYNGTDYDYGTGLPANSTYTQPEINEGFIPQWSKTDKVWSQVENHIGKEGYLNNESYTIKDYGPLPEGFSEEAPPLSLEETKANKITEINSKCSEKIYAGFWYTPLGYETSYHFSYDIVDQGNFTDTMTTINTGVCANQLTLDNNEIILGEWNGYAEIEHTTLTKIPVTAALFVDLYTNGATSHKLTNTNIASTLKIQVEECTTNEEVEAIDIESAFNGE